MTSDAQTSKRGVVESTIPASTMALIALLRRVEVIQEESYLGQRHAEIAHIVRQAFNVLNNGGNDTELECDAQPEKSHR